MTRFAVRLFGIYWRARRNKFPSLRDKLIKADMHMSVEEWLSTITLGSIIIPLLFFPLFIMAAWFLVGHFLVWDTLRNIAPVTPEGIFRLAGELLAVILALAIPMPVWFLIFYSYPSVMISDRRRKIDAQLPYAIGWMSSLALVGVIPYDIFRKLSETEEYYGEMSREAKRLIRDVELLGFDFLTALRNLAAITPSESLRTFLQGALTSTVSGGEMGDYFISKARETMEENRKKFADFINNLGMLSELYITGMVAGPLFIIVMFAAMMMLSGASPQILMIIIYGAIPMGSIFFIALTDSMTPQGVK